MTKKDFVVRLKGECELSLVLEMKGFDPLEEVKAQAARRWTQAINADGQFGRWVGPVSTASRNPLRTVPSGLVRLLARVREGVSRFRGREAPLVVPASTSARTPARAGS